MDFGVVLVEISRKFRKIPIFGRKILPHTTRKLRYIYTGAEASLQISLIVTKKWQISRKLYDPYVKCEKCINIPSFIFHYYAKIARWIMTLKIWYSSYFCVHIQRKIRKRSYSLGVENFDDLALTAQNFDKWHNTL